MSPPLREYVKSWLEKANEDILVIRQLWTGEPDRYTLSICFHAQQAVEKCLKAFLAFHEVNFPKTHDLDYLLSECVKIDATAFAGIDLKSLSDYGVSGRYPDDSLRPDSTEARYYSDTADKVKSIVEPLVAVGNDQKAETC